MIRASYKIFLEISIRAYTSRRAEDSLWKVCEGKQVLNEVARSTGYAGAPALVLAALAAWARERAEIADELIAFRAYLGAL